MPGASWNSKSVPMGYLDCYISIMYYPWPLYAHSAMGSIQTKVTPLDLVLQGSMGVPLGAGGVLPVGMD